MTNVFEEMEKEQNEVSVPQKEEQKAPAQDKKTEFTVDNLGSDETYIKLPDVGESIEFVVEKIEDNPITTGTNKETGEQFGIGCKKKDGSYIRRDITSTNNEVLTVNSWELFYKLFGKESEFSALAKKKNTFKGIKVKITRNYNGAYAMKPVNEIAKLLDKSTEDATKYKAEVATAMKENRLLTVEVSE
jgi:hypothetical protein